ncbi:RapZ C-terminal domain-containing protein [Actinophytocola sp.]|uniref:RapZ C-terminal domain-containing protein n=1 Tax=Actinophytocola sp. TaxID=1872138 RepID=UPI003D6A62D4
MPPVLYVASFGYHHRKPPAANAVIDVRWMPNPFKTVDLHDLSGLDTTVQAWLFGQPMIENWFECLLDVLYPQIQRASEKDSHAITWMFGCAGGHDRSVAVAEHVATSIRRTDFIPGFVGHLDIHTRADDEPEAACARARRVPTGHRDRAGGSGRGAGPWCAGDGVVTVIGWFLLVGLFHRFRLYTWQVERRSACQMPLMPLP